MMPLQDLMHACNACSRDGLYGQYFKRLLYLYANVLHAQ